MLNNICILYSINNWSLFFRNQAGCVEGSQSQHARNVWLPFLFFATHVDQRFCVFIILFTNVSTWMIEYFLAEIKLVSQWFSKHQALVAWKNDPTFFWNGIFQASMFCTMFCAYALCAIMTYFSGRQFASILQTWRSFKRHQGHFRTRASKMWCNLSINIST